MKSELMPGQRGINPQLVDQQDSDQNDSSRKNKGDQARYLIAFADTR